MHTRIHSFFRSKSLAFMYPLFITHYTLWTEGTINFVGLCVSVVYTRCLGMNKRVGCASGKWENHKKKYLGKATIIQTIAALRFPIYNIFGITEKRMVYCECLYILLIWCVDIVKAELCASCRLVVISDFDTLHFKRFILK